ncbi:hypothetical protein AGLY_002052 [Aphis glycines]|uniref:Uncharacterized protein n=1 Tax=Aphis glycines TaxID=307491 RepID=A0A6G0U602_APHGL|nr:hypothetical protein AGLY_002052 [Aphis glycines]
MTIWLLSGEREKEYSNTGVKQRILGLRIIPNLVHKELGPVKRKQRVKMSSVKATIEQVTAMILICADAKDVCSFIRACDYACEAIGLNSVRMKNDEDVLTYTGRVEQLYYNLCNATLANKTPEEARILRQTLKDQALAIYINGLQMDLQTILRARNPETLELAMQMSSNWVPGGPPPPPPPPPPRPTTHPEVSPPVPPLAAQQW